ncbi:MAG: hypothetical protein IT452_07605 [Planctomycetia bacterium]|nr:hypothetical protein [Planctomycetia bacterium]
MKTILALIGLGTLLYGAHLYRHSFDPKPMVEKYDQKLEQAREIQDSSARKLDEVQKATGVEIVDSKKLESQPARP